MIWKVCCEADSPSKALQAATACVPDLAVVELSLKDGHGLECIKDLRHRFPDMPLLVFSMHDESVFGTCVFQAGARGYVNKSEPMVVLLQAIRKVLAGSFYFSDALQAQMSESLFIKNGRRKETASTCSATGSWKCWMKSVGAMDRS